MFLLTQGQLEPFGRKSAHVWKMNSKIIRASYPHLSLEGALQEDLNHSAAKTKKIIDSKILLICLNAFFLLNVSEQMYLFMHMTTNVLLFFVSTKLTDIVL